MRPRQSMAPARGLPGGPVAGLYSHAVSEPHPEGPQGWLETMGVQLTSGKLPAPLNYQLVYRKAN